MSGELLEDSSLPVSRARDWTESEAVGGIDPGTGKQVPRVAVLGVHGVGHHGAGETENAMVDLLLSLPAHRPDDPRSYESFRATNIQIPLQRVRIAPPREPAATPSKGIWNIFQEQSMHFAKVRKHEGAKRGASAHEFTKMLLQDYQGGADGDVYLTTRLEGKRKITGRHEEVEGRAGGEAEVHVYEVLWADLARPNNTVLSFFLALFQLLLHLGSLSRLAIDTGSADNSGWVWGLYGALQRYAVRMLQIFVPLFKVMILVVMLGSVPAVMPKLAASPLLAIGLGAAGGTVGGFLAFNRRRKPMLLDVWLWALLAILPGAVGAASGAGLTYLTKSNAVAGSVECWLLVGAPLLGYILSKYDSIRNGVQQTGWATYLVCFASFLWFLHLTDGDVPLATFWLVEYLVAAVRASWLIMFAFAGVALVLGSLVWRLESVEGKRARLRAAVRTSRFALALPAVLFLLVTPMLWATMFQLANWIQNPFFDPMSLRNPAWIPQWLVRLQLMPDISEPRVFCDYLHTLLGWSLGYSVPITLVLFSAGIFLLLWWALPSATTERFPLRNKKLPPRSSTNAEGVRLGTWLSRGLDATSVVTFLLWCSIFLAPPIVYLLSYVNFGYAERIHTVLELLRDGTEWFVDHPLLAISGAVLVGIVKYGSTVLSILLDVDTYLRTSPHEATPRAMIYERYVSTLRYLANYKDPDGRGYDSVVIVAHSLGSLISGDILRFLHEQQNDPALAKLGYGKSDSDERIPVKLLTMGNPVRQLLNRFFPYLYDWVRDEPDNGLHPLPAPPEKVPMSFPGDSPDPRELGVRKWVNAYRSGDYVGRGLWLDEWYERTGSVHMDGRYPSRVHRVDHGYRCEMCIGAGAHTHYWDDTAPDVAEILDWMIAIEAGSV